MTFLARLARAAMLILGYMRQPEGELVGRGKHAAQKFVAAHRRFSSSDSTRSDAVSLTS